MRNHTSYSTKMDTLLCSNIYLGPVPAVVMNTTGWVERDRK